MDWVDLQADVYQGLQVGVGLQVVSVEQIESLTGAEQGRAGENEILKCSPMGVLSAPTQRQSTQAFPVPGNPVTGQSFQSRPARQKPRLSSSLLYFPTYSK